MNFIRSTFSPLAQFFAAVAIFALLLSLVYGAFPVKQVAAVVQFEYRSSVQVKICHADGVDFSEGKQEVDAESILKTNGHGSHNDKGLDNKGDIIESFEYEYRLKNSDGPWTLMTYPGKNLTTVYSNGLTGEQIMNNGCSLPILPKTDLSITKTASDTTPDEGTNVTFTLTVTNAGPDTATGVVVTDTLPSGLTYVSSNPSITPSGSTLTWNVGSLANGQSAVMTVVALVADDAGNTQLSNTGSVTGVETDSNLNNNSDTEVVEVQDVVKLCEDPNANNQGQPLPCTYTQIIRGCTDVDAVNRNPLANTDDGSCLYRLTVQKIVENSDLAVTNFSFIVDGPTSVEQTAFESDRSNDLSLPLGTYNVTEVLVDNFTPSYQGCQNIVLDGPTTCTITNTYSKKDIRGCTDPLATNYDATANVDDGSCTYPEKGSITLDKVVTGDDANPATIFSFGSWLNSAIQLSANSAPFTISDLSAGSYTITENNLAGTGWKFMGASCLDTETQVVTEIAPGSGDSVVIPLGEGQDLTCTFTNKFQLGCMDPAARNYDAGATKDDGSCDFGEEPQLCSVTLVSGQDQNEDGADDTTTVVEKGGAFAKLLSFVHPAWTAAISGASWIWGDNPVANPVNGVVQTFERQFGFVGDVTSAKLYVASDNSYTATLNSAAPIVDANGVNFTLATQDVHDVTGLINETGNNNLKIQVTNLPGSTDPAANPAGLIYKLVIEGTVTSDADCTVPYIIDEEPTTYTVDGFIWNDTNENGVKDSGESPLAGWTVTATDGESSFTTTTDGNGYYAFSLPAGVWTITQVVQSDWAQTFPSAPTSYSVNAASVVGDDSFNFGNTFTGCVTNCGGEGGGGNGKRVSLTEDEGEVAGDSDSSEPVGEVLGEATSVLPVGAPNTGAGGAAQSSFGSLIALFGMLMSLVTMRVTRHVQ